MHHYKPLMLFLCIVAGASLLAAFSLLASPARGSSINATSILVTTTDDELNADGDCSLREAMMAANTDTAEDACPAGNGSDTILLSAGVYTLTISGNDDDGRKGDLDILEPVSIQGLNTANTIVDGNQIDRVFHALTDMPVSFARLTIRNGRAEDTTLNGGGGILNERSEMILTEVVLRENQAVGGTGGALDNHKKAIIQNSTFMSNTTDSSGGAIFNTDTGTLFLYDSTFYGNVGESSGGAIDSKGSSSIRNVTFYNNTSNDGGAVFTDNNISLINCTFVNNNNAMTSRGGEIQLKNTIVINTLGIDNCDGTIVSKGHNLESGDTCGFTEAGDQNGIADAKLGPLDNNGGPTLTFALEEGSLAIDGGTITDCSPSDQRGASRPVDGNADTNVTCDIGSYERFGLNPVFVYLPLVKR